MDAMTIYSVGLELDVEKLLEAMNAEAQILTNNFSERVTSSQQEAATLLEEGGYAENMGSGVWLPIDK